MSSITAVEVEPIDFPLNDPFEIALGTRTTAKNVQVRVETESGAIGYGEGSPMPPVTGETQNAALSVARTAADLLEGELVEDYRRLIDRIRSTFPGMVSASFALETALLDAYCRDRGLALSELSGGPPRSVETDITIPIVPPDSAHEKATRAVDAGFEQLKVKTGTDVESDIDRALAVAESAPDASLKVDANQGWTVAEAIRFERELREHGVTLTLLEQPVRADDLSGMSRVRDAISAPLAADESVFTPADALAVVRAEAADVLNIKLGKSGLLAADDIVGIVEAANLELMVGCMLESAVGIHTSAHLVAGSGAFSYVDLDANLLLAEDVTEVNYSPTIDIDGPGHGIIPGQ